MNSASRYQEVCETDVGDANKLRYLTELDYQYFHLADIKCPPIFLT